MHAGLLAISLATLPIIPSPFQGHRRRRSHAAHPAAAVGDRGFALHAAFRHQPAAASLVRARASRRDPLPLVRAFQFRIDAGAVELPDAGRAAHDAAQPSGRVVLGIRRLCRGLRAGRVAEQGWYRSRAPVFRFGDAPAPTASDKLSMDRLGRLRFHPAAGRDQPPYAERRADSAAVGGPAEPVPAQLHPVF